MKTIYICFPGGKFKALTMSYDDGREADKRLIKLFNKHGIKGTFHLNAGLIDIDNQVPNDKYGYRIPRGEIVDVYTGHEVSAHTMTHPTVARCPMPHVVNEVVEDRRGLEEIVRYPVRGMSYPNGSYSEEIKNMLPHVGIEYSRVVEETRSFELPTDLYEWKATCHHNNGLLELTDEFIELNRSQLLYLFYVWGHSYEFNRDDNWELIEEFCEKIGNRDDIWYATNIEIVDYMNAFKNLRFSMDSSFVYNPSIQTVWISVNGEIYEIKGGEQVDLT
ncbi:polysaccharide deacetylase family protein [Clostridium paraputrificum]|uniref:Polysaccharide deacetylase n=1 Tax=Clostridium paraputrificum TaxID=29363 RepID=A0A1B8RN59_9CLOT|nr:polysaccharide deacetylase family protein [Clostridium paraputrificum]MDB2103020.1 polysaccharide deacetylase family protein [Clostridium paraputrificum]OBY10154.1 polysaccharide deacetylase [Clostridium paraputrificum]